VTRREKTVITVVTIPLAWCWSMTLACAYQRCAKPVGGRIGYMLGGRAVSVSLRKASLFCRLAACRQALLKQLQWLTESIGNVIGTVAAALPVPIILAAPLDAPVCTVTINCCAEHTLVTYADRM
jgi:hypothetical protein